MATLTFSPTQSFDRAADKPARIGFFSRLTRALMESRERQARREIARVMTMLNEAEMTRLAGKSGTLPF